MVYFVFINTEHNMLKDMYVKAINRNVCCQFTKSHNHISTDYSLVTQVRFCPCNKKKYINTNENILSWLPQKSTT